MTRLVGPSSLYARTALAVVRRPVLGLSLLWGSLMHAIGHGFLAGAGGALARGLAGGSLMDAGSTSVLARLGHGDALLGLAILGLFAAAAKLVGSVIAVAASARLSADVGAAVRLDVLDRVLGPRHGDQGAAQLAAMTLHVGDVERGVAEGVLAEARAAVALVPLAILLVVLAPKLAMSALVALFAFACFAFVVRRAFKRAHAKAALTAGALVAAADEAVRHAELWATYGATAKIRAHVERAGRAIAIEGARLSARAALLSGTSEVLGALALVLVLALAAAGAIGDVDRGTVLPFAIVFFMAYKPLRDLVDARIHRMRAEEALRAATAGEPRRVSDARRSWPLAPLTIQGFAGAHGAHAPLDLRVPPGRIVAIVGRAGIGKTSLLRALLGLDPPRSGRVVYGDRDVTEAKVGPAERPFAWVPQDAPVIGDTLAANVALGAADDVRGHAAILAEIGAELDTGDAILATERAVSGGERQWIAVARALATELPVLLLDEPTSALDARSQAAVLSAIARLRGKRTVILVTHRKEPLAIADVVVDLEARLDEREQEARLDLDPRRAEQLAVEDVRALVGPRDADA